MSIDRRRHRLFVTRHTEYHLREDECVGVRDRNTGEWMRHHVALRMRAIELPPLGYDHCWFGRRIQFLGGGTDVVTSPVVAVGRPQRECLERYVSLATAGSFAV
jgi:hypothetical protein